MRLRAILFAGLAVTAGIVAAGGIMLSRMDFTPYYKGAIIDKVAQATGRKLAIGGELKVTILPVPAFTVKNVALSNSGWAASPQMVTVDELSAQVALLPLLFAGKLHIDRLVLNGVDLQLATDAAGNGNWQFAPPTQSPPPPASGGSDPLELPGFDEIALHDIAIHFDDGQTHQTKSMGLTDLTISGSPAGPMKVKAAATYQGLPIRVDGTIGALSSLMTPGPPYMIDAVIDVAGATIKLIGSVAEPFKGRGLNFTVSLDGQDLGPIGALLDVPVPAKPYHFAATVTGNADGTIAFDAVHAAFGASMLSGEARLAVGGARPRLSSALTAPMIDLTGWPEPKVPAPHSANDGRVFAKDPLPLSALRVADADIALNIDTLKIADTTLQNLALHLTLDDRVLRLRPVAFDMGGGHVGGSADLSARQAPATLAIDINAKHLDIGRLLAQISGNDLLDGRGDLAVAAHGTGDSVRAIMATLNGTSSLVIGRGIIKNRYADLVGADVFREAFAWTQGKHDTKLTCMVSRFDIRGGLATSRDLLIDTSDATIVGTGTISLGSERLDLELTPRPKEASLLNLAIPIDIGGTFKQPTVQPNRLAMAEDVAKGVVTWINPLFALLPLVLDSSDDKTPCVTAIEMRKNATDGTQHKASKKDGGGVAGVVNGFGQSIKNIFK